MSVWNVVIVIVGWTDGRTGMLFSVEMRDPI